MSDRFNRRDVGEALVFYTEPGQGPATRLDTARQYAEARAAIPTFCLDALVCGHTTTGTPAVVLVVRSATGESAGPFRDEPWVVGGRWDMVTPFEDFVRDKASTELFAGADPRCEITGPLGNQLFATGWATDGPFGLPGVTVQYCYQLVLADPLDSLPLRDDDAHAGILVLRADEPPPHLHPYIRDVIRFSRWLDP